ncbi:hypothetical protein G7Y89_g13790 [Cudoniella acicularis]|uniref:Peptidase S33 tripeptidyl aminopeptidase-like C-terminal domain-containing protein n=1 Tax=Cudoniella acicularis TaxID=354080 RepID=A0A8H4R7K3_9HELO|nr:hypothetical protein G7Y89_g13790 [Cudoniella acicularis]
MVGDWAEGRYLPSSTNLNWSPCDDGQKCAVLDVPLYYDHPNGTRARVPLTKYPASTKPYLGMVLYNPSGPGESAISRLDCWASRLMPIIGSNYDLVTWEPRGIEFSTPNTNCTLQPNSTAYLIPRTERRWEKITGSAGSFTSLRNFYDFAQKQGQYCEERTGGPNNAGQYMSTGVVVKDMLTILDAYAAHPDSKNTFVMMASDRVRRVILDGAVDADDYYSSVYLSNPRDTDAEFSSFFVYCHLAGPEHCDFYTGTLAYNIFTRFERLLARLDTQTSAIQGWANASAIATVLSAIRAEAFISSYSPRKEWTALANILVSFEKRAQDLKTKALAVPNDPQVASVATSREWRAAVFCTNTAGTLYGQTLEQMSPIALAQEQQSYVGGEVFNDLRVDCAGWPIKGMGTYRGSFGGPAKNPILFASSTRDPVTPQKNCLKAACIFEGAQCLIADGVGHITQSLFNKCTNAKINAYFQTGQLPGKDSFCPQEAGSWGVMIPGNMTVDEYADYDAIKAKFALSNATTASLASAATSTL